MSRSSGVFTDLWSRRCERAVASNITLPPCPARARAALLWWFSSLLFLLLVLALARPAAGALGDCGQPRSNGALPTATDALEILKTAVGASSCAGFDPCICDVNSSGSVTASDALVVLQKAVGLEATLICPCIATTTTTTSTTTTTLAPVSTTELMVLTRLEGTYSTADLAGTWDVNELESGPGGPYWARGAITIASNGVFSGTVTDIDGFSDNISGRLSLSASGLLTCIQNCPPNLNGAIDSGKTAGVVTTDTDEGDAELIVFTRRGASYTQADAAGAWGLHALTSGYGQALWTRGALTVASNGSLTGMIVDSDGFGGNISGSLPLSGTGGVTCVSSACPDQFHGALDSGKTVAAATATADDGAGELALLCKRGASYSQADLTGTWRLNSMVSGQDEPWWSRGTLNVAANGDLSGTITGSDGSMNPAEGTLTMSPTGTVTISGDADFLCAMDAGKTVVVCTDSY